VNVNEFLYEVLDVKMEINSEISRPNCIKGRAISGEVRMRPSPSIKVYRGGAAVSVP
jgi:hypothetical protein